MENIALEELAQLMGTRAHMYNMLSRAFVAEADDEFIRQLRSMHFPQGTGSAATARLTAASNRSLCSPANSSARPCTQTAFSSPSASRAS